MSFKFSHYRYCLLSDATLRKLQKPNTRASTVMKLCRIIMSLKAEYEMNFFRFFQPNSRRTRCLNPTNFSWIVVIYRLSYEGCWSFCITLKSFENKVKEET